MINRIIAECKKLGHIVVDTSGDSRTFISNLLYKNVVDVSWSRSRKFICVDNDNYNSVYYIPYTRHRRFSVIMKKIQEKLKEK